MKRYIFSFSLFNLFFSLSLFAQTDGHRIEVTIDGFEQDSVYLGYRRADKVYSRDTIGITDGKFVFKGEEPLPAGIYIVLMPPDNKFFEFVVTKKEQHFSISTKVPDFFNHLKFEDTQDNQLLYDYQKYMSGKVKATKALQEQMAATTDEANKAKLQSQIRINGDDVKAHQRELIAKYPGTYTARLVAAFQEVDIPEAPLKADGTPDKAFQFRYYRSHYWDGFDVSDEVWLNTPYLKEKMDRYLDKLTVQHPDSVILAVEEIVQPAMKNENTLKYILPYLLNKYYKPEIMGLDKVYVHLSDKYYRTGIASWTDEEQLKKITDDAYMIRNVLLGNQAPNVKVQKYDPAKHEFTTELISPYDVDAEFTIVFLWKPGCGHCKKMTEDLKPFYEEYKNKGVEIFSMTSANHMDLEKALKDIKEKDMPWIITADPYQRARAMQNFYGTSLPKLYILDKDKKILANRVGVEQLPVIIEDFKKKNGVDK